MQGEASHETDWLPPQGRTTRFTCARHSATETRGDAERGPSVLPLPHGVPAFGPGAATTVSSIPRPAQRYVWGGMPGHTSFFRLNMLICQPLNEERPMSAAPGPRPAPCGVVVSSQPIGCRPAPKKG